MANESILIIDDNHDSRLFLAKAILEPAGYRVATASDGQEGIHMALAAPPDLMLLNLQMPRQNGVQILTALRKRQLQLPVILMTFHGAEELLVKAFRLGVRDYVIKPFSPEEIMAAVELALTESRLRKERDALTSRLMHANHRLGRRLRELSALAGIGRAVTALMDTEDLLCRALEGAIYLVRGNGGTVVLRHPGEEFFHAHVVKTVASPRAQVTTAPVDDPIALEVIDTLQAVAVNAADNGQLPGNAQAGLYVPLTIGQHAIGAIGITSNQSGRQFSKNDRNLLGAVADYTAVALQNSRLFHELEGAKEREKQELRRIFQTYVSPSVVEQVISDPESLKLGGVRQQVTVFYADIRGSTALAERTEPEELISVLNGYLSAMAHTILENQGTLDKFQGDAVMAFFNAPTPQPDHTLRAARTALAMHGAVNEHRQSTSILLSIGVGFTTGPAVVGHVGTTDLMNYTVIGDTVNLAKRLQEEAKPGQILMNASTYKLIQDQVVARPLGTIPLRGKARSEPLFELVRLRD